MILVEHVYAHDADFNIRNSPDQVRRHGMSSALRIEFGVNLVTE